MSSAHDFMSNVADMAVARVKSKLPRFSWGFVDSVSPLRLRLDGSSAPMTAKPSTLVSGLREGDRVFSLLVGKRATIIGINGGGDTGWIDLPLASGFTGDAAVRRVNGIVYWKGVVSSTAGWASSFGTVVTYANLPGWCVPAINANNETYSELSANLLSMKCSGAVSTNGLRIRADISSASIRLKGLGGYFAST